MVLTERDRQELHAAISEYLKVQGLSADIVQGVETAFAAKPATAFPDKGSAIERRWNTLRRLNVQNTQLENQVKQLQKELVELQDPTKRAAKSKHLLPSEPALQTLPGHRDTLTSVAFHPYEALCYSTSEDGSFRVWDLETRRQLQAHKYADGITCCAVEPAEGRLIAVGSSDMTVRLFDDEKECAVVMTLHGHEDAVTALAWLERVEGPRQPSSNNDEGATESMVSPADKKKQSSSSSSSASVGAQLVSGARDGEVRVWDTSHGSLVCSIKNAADWLRCLAVNPWQQTVAVGGNDEEIHIWSLATKRLVTTLRDGHDNVIQSVAFSHPESDAALIEAHGGAERKLQWKEQMKLAKQRQEREGGPLQMPGGGGYLVSGSRDKNICLWDVATGVRVMTFSDHNNWIRGVAFAADGKHLVSCSDDGTVGVFDLTQKKRVRSIAAHDHFVSCFALDARSGRPLMLTGSADNTIKIWPCN